MKLLLAALLAAPAAAAPAKGRFYSYSFLGCSPDASRCAIAWSEETADGARGHVQRFNPVQGVHVGKRETVELAGERGAAKRALDAARERMAKTLKTDGVSPDEQGFLLYSNPPAVEQPKDLWAAADEAPRIARFGERWVSLSTATAPSTDPACKDTPTAGLTVTAHSPRDRRILQRDNKVPRGRGCAKAYVLYEIRELAGHLAVVVMALAPGAGEDPAISFVTLGGKSP